MRTRPISTQQRKNLQFIEHRSAAVTTFRSPKRQRRRSVPVSSASTTPQEHREAIGAAAKELNDLRERWLNPPEWTQTRTLEFPGSLSGHWARYIDPKTVDPKTGVGTVRYPRLEPRDADCAAKLKKRTLTNLYNERPAWLDLAHKKLDTVVAAAYAWPPDLSDDQILERLLALNLERAAEEEARRRRPQAKNPARQSRPRIALTRRTGRFAIAQNDVAVLFFDYRAGWICCSFFSGQNP